MRITAVYDRNRGNPNPLYCPTLWGNQIRPDQRPSLPRLSYTAVLCTRYRASPVRQSDQTQSTILAFLVSSSTVSFPPLTVYQVSRKPCQAIRSDPINGLAFLVSRAQEHRIIRGILYIIKENALTWLGRISEPISAKPLRGGGGRGVRVHTTKMALERPHLEQITIYLFVYLYFYLSIYLSICLTV